MQLNFFRQPQKLEFHDFKCSAMAILLKRTHNKPKFGIMLLIACELSSSHLLFSPKHKRRILAIMNTSPAVTSSALTHLPSTIGLYGFVMVESKTNQKRKVKVEIHKHTVTCLCFLLY